MGNSEIGQGRSIKFYLLVTGILLTNENVETNESQSVRDDEGACAKL